MTAKELTEIVTQNTLAIAENTKTIAQLTNMVLTTHQSVKSLEITAVAHNEALDQLTADIAALSREWQAYIKTLPQN